MLPIKIYRVRSRSMEPALREGDYVIVRAWRGGIKDGDVVILRHPLKNMSLVKRVKWIDSKSVYAVGDNGAESEDSRTLGPFDVSSIMGKVLFSV
ncbi:MAG: S26 family signal peptidase [Candidatus Micrarchaeota archaeon]|nr:S26 family signal peptidase [Candidatus Micrarchaeota archaeon]